MNRHVALKRVYLPAAPESMPTLDREASQHGDKTIADLALPPTMAATPLREPAPAASAARHGVLHRGLKPAKGPASRRRDFCSLAVAV